MALTLVGRCCRSPLLYFFSRAFCEEETGTCEASAINVSLESGQELVKKKRQTPRLLSFSHETARCSCMTISYFNSFFLKKKKKQNDINLSPTAAPRTVSGRPALPASRTWAATRRAPQPGRGARRSWQWRGCVAPCFSRERRKVRFRVAELVALGEATQKWQIKDIARWGVECRQEGNFEF